MEETIGDKWLRKTTAGMEKAIPNMQDKGDEWKRRWCERIVPKVGGTTAACMSSPSMTAGRNQYNASVATLTVADMKDRVAGAKEKFVNGLRRAAGG